jgi:hypothetical protein
VDPICGNGKCESPHEFAAFMQVSIFPELLPDWSIHHLIGL